jgi:hypothetical protein
MFECIVNYIKGIECTNESVTDLEGFDLEDSQFPKNEIAFGMSLKSITSLLSRVGITQSSKSEKVDINGG